MSYTLIKKFFDGFHNYYLKDDKSKTIATTAPGYPDTTVKKLSFTNCEAVFNGYDLDELAKKEAEKLHDFDKYRDLDIYNQLIYEDSQLIKIGFQKALELLGDKKCSIEDVIKFIKFRDEYFNPQNLSLEAFTISDEELFDKYHSLQQSEWDVEIEMECGCGGKYLTLNGVSSTCCGDKKPKLDKDGCLILKRVLNKTKNANKFKKAK